MNKEKLTHRIYLRRSEFGQVVASYPIAEDEIEYYKEKYASFFTTIRKVRQVKK
jgi:hypothetical protein